MKTKQQNNLRVIKGGKESRIDSEIAMLPLAKCREVINQDGIIYTDEEIVKIRELFYRLAAIIHQQNEIETKENSATIISLEEHKKIIKDKTEIYEKSNYLCKG